MAGGCDRRTKMECKDILNLIAIFIIPVVAVIVGTISVSADNKNIEQLKNCPSSDCKPKNGKALSLFSCINKSINTGSIIKVYYSCLHILYYAYSFHIA